MAEVIKAGEIGKGSTIIGYPKVYKNNLLFGNTEGEFYCLNKNNGKEKWKNHLGGKILGSPSAKNNSIYIGTGKYLYKLDKNGKGIWRFKTGGVVSGLTLYKDLVLFVSTDNCLYITDKKGNLKLKYRTGDEVFVNPTIHKDKIYFGSSDGHFYCIDFKGKLEWKFNTDGEISTFDGFDIVDEKLYFGASNYYIYCIDLKGNLVWKKRTGDVPFSTPRVDGENLYIGGRDGNFYCLDKDTGKEKWIFKFYTGCYSTPVIKNNRVYFGTAYPRNLFLSLNKTTGKKIWSFKATSGVATPALEKTKEYICCGNGSVFCINKEGEKLWHTKTGSGKPADLTKAIPPPKVNPDALKDMIKEQLELEEPFEDTYERGTVIRRDEISQEEYASLRELGGYQKPNSGVTKYKGSPDEEKRKREKKEKEEFCLRREGRM